MLETLFQKKQKVEEVPHTHQAKEALKFEQEERRQKNFFKRKKINPFILYNTLIYITPFFDDREEDWEKFLKLIIRENEHRRPNIIRVQTWFHETFHATHGTLNHSEAKYLCRYVKMSSMSKDRESKLREAIDNIDLPPIKYDSWVNEVFTLEFDDLVDLGEAQPVAPSRNYFKEAFDSVVTTVEGLHSSYSNRNEKTFPDCPQNPRTIKRRLSNSRLSLTSKPTRSRYRPAPEGSSGIISMDLKKNANNINSKDNIAITDVMSGDKVHTEDDTTSTDSNNDSGDAIDQTKAFSLPAIANRDRP